MIASVVSGRVAPWPSPVKRRSILKRSHSTIASAAVCAALFSAATTAPAAAASITARDGSSRSWPSWLTRPPLRSEHGSCAASTSRSPAALPLTLADYVELLAATAAAVRAPDRKAALPADSARILTRIGIDSAHWIQTVRDYRRRFFSMVGSVHSIEVYCARTERQQVKGSVWAARVFRDCARREPQSAARSPPMPRCSPRIAAEPSMRRPIERLDRTPGRSNRRTRVLNRAIAPLRFPPPIAISPVVVR